MTSLAQRSTQPEEMDADTTTPETYARCLADLARLNALTLTHRATLAWIARIAAPLPPQKPLAILDVACGHGDLLRAIARWAARAGRPVTLHGVDLNPRSAEAARAATPPETNIHFHTADVFAFTPDPPADLIVTSQFTHHLTDEDLVRFLRWLTAQARIGWCITDLHRSALAYYGFPLLARAAGYHRIVRQDGQISIARGFRRQDWQNALAQAGVTADIAWVFPFRYRITHAATAAAPALHAEGGAG